MASEQRLYTFSPNTKSALRSFRLGTSRAKQPQAMIYHIDKKTLDVLPDHDGEVYASLQDLADALPENAPRFVVLSFPLTSKDGRTSTPYVLLSYLPATCTSEARMLYAGARELMRAEAETSRVLELEDEEGVLGVDARLVELAG